MEKNEKILRISIAIFCDQKYWHYIILEVLIPILEEYEKSNAFYLALCKERGDHVKFYLEVTEFEVNKIIKEVDRKIKKSLVSINVSDENINILKKGIFCDFNSNSIHYGIYEEKFVSIPLQKELTKLLILVLREYKEELLSFQTEIMIELLSVFYHNSILEKTILINVFEIFLNSQYNKYNVKSLERIKDVNNYNFESNYKHLKNLVFGKDQKSQLDYQKKWLCIIKSYDSWLVTIPKTQTKALYLFNKLNDVFGINDRISPYFLVLNVLKSNQKIK